MPQAIIIPHQLLAGRESWRLLFQQALEDKVLDCLQVDYASRQPTSPLRQAANRGGRVSYYVVTSVYANNAENERTSI